MQTRQENIDKKLISDSMSIGLSKGFHVKYFNCVSNWHIPKIFHDLCTSFLKFAMNCNMLSIDLSSGVSQQIYSFFQSELYINVNVCFFSFIFQLLPIHQGGTIQHILHNFYFFPNFFYACNGGWIHNAL